MAMTIKDLMQANDLSQPLAAGAMARLIEHGLVETDNREEALAELHAMERGEEVAVSLGTSR